jgi:ubiquinone/menaquinone biosynthesis C-methylase UbiE
VFDQEVKTATRVLDVGCGSGFIVNFLANRYPHIQFDAIDFSDSIDYAQQFGKTNNITNTRYIKQDFLKWDSSTQYDVVLCNGVLHHIPEYLQALEKIKQCSSNKIIIGIYNTYGKLLKNFVPVVYKNQILYQDQEKCPFEMSFTDQEFKQLFKDYTIKSIYPSYKNYLVDLRNLFNYKNGGLTVYVFKNL